MERPGDHLLTIPQSDTRLSLVKTYRTAEGALFEVLDGRAAIVNPEGTELVTLNQVGSLIWSALEQRPGSGVEYLVGEVVAATDAPIKSEVESDARKFLSQLVDRGLVIAEPDGR
jgi:hypothetical protein